MNNNTMTHHALTLGPIIKTLSEARATRELWAASYMFSYISKMIIRELRHTHKIPYESFLVPTIPDKGALWQMLELDPERPKGVGLFPDRIIFEYEENVELGKIVAGVIEDFAGEVAQKIGKQAVVDFLKNYIQCYTLQMDIPKGENAPAIISPYLDSMELQRSFAQEDKGLLSEFLNSVTKSFLIKDAWGETKKSFKTLLEVALEEYQNNPIVGEHLAQFAKQRLNEGTYQERKQKDDELDTKIMEEVRKNKEELQLKQAHNYIAIVQADGDNVGSIINSLQGEEYTKFSNLINSVNAEAVNEIQENYKGMNIYAGGDDIFFFAPVFNGEDNIFILLERLDNMFKEAFKGYKMNGKEPSLSFGVSITYYKFPLHEAHRNAQKLLFEKAKREPKNNLALTIQKHSGERFKGVYNLSSCSYKIFQKLMASCLQNPNNKLSSIVFKIRENEAMFKAIWEDAKKVENFIDNSFDEDVHKESDIENYLKTIKKLIPQVFKEVHDLANNPKDQEAIDKADNKALQTIYGMIRTVSFLISTEIKL